MKKITLTVLFFTFTLLSYCQLNKKTWLVGGSGNFYSVKRTYAGAAFYSESNDLNLNLSPNIGYFVKDKFVIGLKPYFNWFKSVVTTTSGLYSNSSRFGIGPFGRYYFLKKEKQYNILAEASYQHGFNSASIKGNSNTFTFLTGPVIYFNSTVGLEFLFGYSSTIENTDIDRPSYTKTTRKGLAMNIGFQFHLEK